MISIFTTIQADLSPEFRQKCSNSVIDTESLLQKIGEVTGAVLITDGETPKFVGSWNSVKNTYDILSGFLLYRSLLGVDKRGEVTRGGIEENRRSVETFRYINSVYEREKPQMYHNERTHNSPDNLYRSHNTVDLSNEHHFDENVHSRMTDKGQDYNATQITGNFEGDCMDIEKLSAFYKEESQNSVSKRFTETAVKIPNSSYIQNIPAVNSPVQNSQNSRNDDTGAIKIMNYSINRKKTVARMYNEVVHCDECSYQSYSKRNLLFHKARTHIRPYKCKHCGRGFGLMKDLRRHYQKKRDCKQYTFVRYRQVGNKTVEERINVDNFGTNENNFDTESDQNTSFENQQISQETISSERNIDNSMATEVDNSQNENESSGRGDTVSILPLDESQKMSSTDVQNEDSQGQSSKVMIENNEMYLKKRSDDEDENTFIVHISKNDSENGENDNDDYCVVKINPDMDEEDLDNSSKTDLSESEHCAFTSQDQSCSEKNMSNKKLEEVMPGRPVEGADQSDRNNASHDTAVIDLSQFSLDGEDTMEKDSHLDSPSTSFQTGKQHRKYTRKDLRYVVMKSERQKEHELKMTFPCSYCDYSTHRLKLIEDHVKRVHFKKFECNQCGTRFGLKKDLNRHYRRTHKIDLELQRRGRRPVDSLDDSEMIDEQEDGSRESMSMIQETDTQT